MLKYTITMSVRVVCLALCVVVPGWWLLIPAVGAVFLPYFAVIIANNVSGRSRRPVLRPGAIVLGRPESAPPAGGPGRPGESGAHPEDAP